MSAPSSSTSSTTSNDAAATTGGAGAGRTQIPPGGSRTVMWCVPRAISSAFAKCMSFVEDTEVWFEPYVYCYLTRVEYKLHTGDDLPNEYEGNEEVFHKAKLMLDTISQTTHVPERLSYATAKRNLETSTSKHVWVKDMGSSITPEYRQFLPEGYKHTFLIRDPTRSIYSYRKAFYKHFNELGLLTGPAADWETYDVERDERFFPEGCYTKELYDLWVYLKDNGDGNTVVIDADDLLNKPKETLTAYCAAIGLPYHDGLLKWDASTDNLKKMKSSGDTVVEDLVTFYGTAMKSSSFMPPSVLPPRDQLHADVVRCSDRVMKYFEEMYEHRIKV